MPPRLRTSRYYLDATKELVAQYGTDAGSDSSGISNRFFFSRRKRAAKRFRCRFYRVRGASERNQVEPWKESRSQSRVITAGHQNENTRWNQFTKVLRYAQRGRRGHWRCCQNDCVTS